MNLLQTLEQEEIARLGKTIPDFNPGDTVVVSVNVVEGTRKRVQAYEGVVIAKRNRGLNSNFIVRKISSGEGVERTFQLYSPLIAKIEVKRRGDVRRAKLYYLRERSGNLRVSKKNWCVAIRRLRLLRSRPTNKPLVHGHGFAKNLCAAQSKTPPRRGFLWLEPRVAARVRGVFSG